MRIEDMYELHLNRDCWGIAGYNAPRRYEGLPSVIPQQYHWSVPKQKLSNFLDEYKDHAQKIPDPAKYKNDTHIKWISKE